MNRQTENNFEEKRKKQTNEEQLRSSTKAGDIYLEEG
jgi:hypothetical protein